ncbi:MAG: putative esterase [Candidatus Midichloria mitochondrii]|uniref:Phospholipase Carboxylesterase n=1 Tax=Midichloria mitochondrii (strain IricVA) TaxID=696127 RepID=F7XW66_MIDMI|nr:dienelactone hydrolase family protein [Candidatus Midichloria mitochondrii]AEI88915.1 phospholipase Carboxylesterase [Candidatus Midichloria mitochondrii IricVA]MDJ1256779.1 dienelactone hydrolase family protein [Candidatus Midichloria mitochondrii]MDJ1288492.1 dienelactone hydrolase family protein [Candidatus Midichloria mitochondrii]MDJ1299338.1 dienelactone hydrolase family protein [Candidatus Midichloria mitochondrii]MDJ1313463.1 dienelactone hydrolase family protein [Candidatus Midichl
MLNHVIYPNSSISKPSKLVFLLHGYGSNKNDLINLAPDLQAYLPDSLFISPNAPENFEGNDYFMDAYQWFSLTDRSEEKMLTGASKSSIILENFITEQAKKFSILLENIALIGFSQGAMMAMHLGLRLPHTVKGIIGYSGLLIAPSKLKNVIKSKPRVMLIHGTEDTIVPIKEMEKAYNALDDNGVMAHTYRCNRLAHGIDSQGIKIGGGFLREIFAN